MSAANGLYRVFVVVDLDVERAADGHVVFVGYTEHWKRRIAEIRRGYRSSVGLRDWLAERGDRAAFRCIADGLSGREAQRMARQYADTTRARFNRQPERVVPDTELAALLAGRGAVDKGRSIDILEVIADRADREWLFDQDGRGWCNGRWSEPMHGWTAEAWAYCQQIGCDYRKE